MKLPLNSLSAIVAGRKLSDIPADRLAVEVDDLAVAQLRGSAFMTDDLGGYSWLTRVRIRHHRALQRLYREKAVTRRVKRANTREGGIGLLRAALVAASISLLLAGVTLAVVRGSGAISSVNAVSWVVISAILTIGLALTATLLVAFTNEASRSSVQVTRRSAGPPSGPSSRPPFKVRR